MPTPTSPSKSPESNSAPLPPPPHLLPHTHPSLASHPLETPPSNLPKAPGLPCPKIFFVNTAAFQCACKLEGSVQFALSLNSMSAHSTSISNTTTDDPIDLFKVPLEYHDYVDVFSKKKASTLTPHRPFNLNIKLEEGAEPPIGRLYSLSPSKQEALRGFLDEHLMNSFICQSSSPHATPVLFIQKKDGSLCLCVNFQGLNKIMKKDQYPLPRTSNLLEAPSRVKIYMKLNL